MFDTEGKEKAARLRILLLIILSVLFGVAAVRHMPASLENNAQDHLYRDLSGIPENIKIIGIDDESLELLGPYSDWDREYFVRLLEMLNADEDHRPLLIGMDILFSGTDDSETDRALAEAAGRYSNVVAASSVESGSELLRDEKDDYYIRTFINNEYKPYEALAEKVEWGFTNSIIDDDGIVRRTYTQIPPDHRSFSYLIASRLAELPEYHTREEIVYSVKPGETEVISMARVLDGTVPASYFADAIVLVGAYSGGMMDSYKVPCDYSRQMYGVEMHANYITAFLHHRIATEVPGVAAFFVTALLCIGFGLLVMKSRIRSGAVLLGTSFAVYVLAAYVLFRLSYCKLPLISPLLGFAFLFICSLLLKYIDLIRQKQQDAQNMLMSMAEAFAEAIEGRTPYNANHTKNVAKRCIEMLDHINRRHREGKTELSFTDNDKKQLYLAAMLHDVGKMDVPLEVMDKPTKLGSKEDGMRARLQIIRLKNENDILRGRTPEAAGREEIGRIDDFISRIGAFNCGRPLKEDEWACIGEMETGYYEEPDGSRIPYLMEEERDDLHIRAGTLSDNERKIMQSHVVYTDKILSRMIFGEDYKDVRAMASNHHELLNGKGYPKQLGAADLDVMTRILTIMDIYDSLIADDRPYKKPKPVKVAFEILDEEAEAGKVDKELLAFAKELYLQKEKSDDGGDFRGIRKL